MDNRKCLLILFVIFFCVYPIVGGATESALSTSVIDSIHPHYWPVTLLLFWLSGVFLAFTPCVLPLLFMISNFVTGQVNDVSKKSALSLSIVYTLSIAFTFALTGVIAALTGTYIQAYFQNVWFIGALSFVFLLMGLSMLDFFNIALPDGLRRNVLRFNKFKSEYSYYEVAIMGVAAILIASPCIAAPLVSALSYLVTMKDIAFAATSLFFLGLGVGSPLVFTIAFSKNVFNVSPAWSEITKSLFGMLLIYVSIWSFCRIIPEFYCMIISSAFFIFAAIYIYSIKLITTIVNEDATDKITRINKTETLKNTVAVLVLLYGVTLFLSSMGESHTQNMSMNHSASMAGDESSNHGASFIKVNNVAEFSALLNFAKIQAKPVLVKFTSEWCYACISMEDHVYSQPDVHKAISSFVAVSVDITDIKAPAYAIAKLNGVLAAPMVIFYGVNGKKIDFDIVGDMSSQDYLEALMRASQLAR